MEVYEDYKQEIVNSIRNNDLYDFICMNSYRIDIDILKDLLLECIATLPEEENDNLIDNLIDYKEWEVE